MHTFTARTRDRALAGLVLLLGCSSPGPTGTSQSQQASTVVLVHTKAALLTVQVDDWASNPLRQRVESFYPSMCVDVDADDDDVPDTLDVERSGEDSDDSEGHELDHRCKPCNRGPGTAGDFRLRVEGQSAELQRGRVFTRAADGTLVVPSPDGPITIRVTTGTRQDKGAPTPGAEIRVKGSVSSAGPRTITAAELEVLCPGPAPVGDGDVPPGAHPAPTDPPPPVCKPRDFRCAASVDCCAGLVCNAHAAGDPTCGPVP